MDPKTRQQKIKSLLSDERWDAIAFFYKEIMDKWKDESPMRENEFETLKAVFVNEGKKQGLKDFIALIESNATL